MTPRLQILILGTNGSQLDAVRRVLRGARLAADTRAVSTERGFLRALATFVPDVVISACSPTPWSAPAALQAARAASPGTPFIVLATPATEAIALECLNAGADDYVLHGRLKRLPFAVRGALGRRRAEQARADAEARYGLLFEHSLDGIYRSTPEGRFIDVNPAFVSMLGYATREEVLALDIPRDVYWSDAERRPASQRNTVFKERLRCRDGTELWVENSSRAILNDGGKVVYYEGSIRDISERKRTEEALLASEERFRSAFGSAPIGMALVGLEGRWLQVNRALCEIFGYSEAELLATTFQALTHPEDLETQNGLLRAILAGERHTYQMEKRYFHKDGHIVWVQLSSSLIRGTDGRPLYFIAQLQDVTERKRAEEALRKSEERYRELFENANDMIYTHDLDGNYISFNKAAERITGYGRAEALTMNVAELLPPGELERGREQLRRKVAGEVTTTAYETEIVAKSGRRVQLEISSRLILDENGRPVGVQGIARDATERKRLADQLQQAQKMEVVGKLAGGVAHDFNNLLTVITGRAQMLLKRLPPGDLLRRDAELIEQTAERAAALTHQLLAFSRRQVLSPKIVDLNAVLAGLEAMLRRMIGEGVELVMVPGKDLGRVHVDPGQIEQVITNLVVNASDAMPDVGRLTIETANVDLEEAPGGGGLHGACVMLAVTDTGRGMDEETRAHLFEPFFTTKARGRGTGLGLSTVYGIVEQSGGAIRVESEPGRGTTIRVYLPRMERAVDVSEPARSLAQPLYGSEVVLLVEDEEGVLELARESLRIVGYSVLESSNGPVALEIAARHPGPIHLLLSDVVMPDMSGPELARRLGLLRPDTKVLFMSGYTSEGMLEPGAALLQKPFTLDVLARAVREVLDAPRRGR
jgi:PAS domain S-box-containing protein